MKRRKEKGAEEKEGREEKSKGKKEIYSGLM